MRPQRPDHVDGRVGVSLPEPRAVPSPARDLLRAAQVQVERHDVVDIIARELKSPLGRLADHRWVVAGELRRQGPVAAPRRELALEVLDPGLARGQAGVQHRRVAEPRAVAPRELAERQFALVDHGGAHMLGTADRPPPGLAADGASRGEHSHGCDETAAHQ